MSAPASPTDLDQPNQPKDADMTDIITTPTPDAPRTAGATGIRVATAVVGGTIAVLAIGLGALGQFGVAGAATTQSIEAIPASVTSIEIDNAVGDVSVFSTPGAEPSVDIRVDAGALNRMEPPSVQIEGGELSIDVADRNGPCWFACWGSVTILVELGDQALDELDITSEVGTIAVTAIEVRELTVGSDVGDVRVDGVTATSIDAGSDVGTVQLFTLESTRSITAETAVGDIEIGVQPGVDYDVRASSEIGDVSNDLLGSTSATNSIIATSDVGSVTIFVIR